MILFLQANDTFFFRDGRPFRKGDQSEGYSIFPPLPPTILGALRTAYIATYGDLSAFYSKKMVSTIGTPDSLGSMQLKGVFLADRISGVYFPIPLDLIVKKKDEEDRLYPLKINPVDSNLRSNTLLTRLLRWDVPEDVASETSGKLDSVYMASYLLGKKMPFRFFPEEHFVCSEPKIGIQRNRKTLASEESMLYRINMSRFQSASFDLSALGFVVDYCCTQALPGKGLLKLGGEGKSFVYEPSQHNPDPFSKKADLNTLKNGIKKSGCFKLYFASPSIFKRGWLPMWIDEETRQGQYPSSHGSVSVELVTAAVGKPITIGGWDMKKRRAKPTYRAVPAGSVYYFKVLDGSCVDDIINTFHYKNISDCQSAEGFGLCFVGVA